MTASPEHTPPVPSTRSRRPSLLRRLWLPGLIVLSVGITAAALLRPSGPSGTPVNVVKALSQTFTRTVSGTGTAKAQVARNVNFPVSGTVSSSVASVNVAVGDAVKAGGLLARLDSAAQSRELQSAQAALTAASSDLERARAAASDAAQDLTRSRTAAELTLASAQDALSSAQRTLRNQLSLHKLGAVSDQDLITARSAQAEAQRKLDQARSELRYAVNRTPQSTAASVAGGASALAAARVRVQNAQAALRDAELRAPVGGVISAVNVSVGNAPGGTGGPAFVITDPAQLYLQVPFDETRAPDLRPGQPVSVAFDALPDKAATGTVDRVDPTADASGNAASVVVRIRLPGVVGVKPGFTGTATVTVRRIVGAVTVPIEATLEGASKGSLKVFRVTPEAKPVNGQLTGTAQPLTLTLLDRNTNLAAVTGLKAGDLIVNTPSPELAAGARVTYSDPAIKSAAKP
ncbi:HlyD family efflux transporter periplasmic adaptor subunit [Deinococcus sp.]|uniref:efflux RND transporter periplasmic adaptor subunit n=1 Tax=Deinococcus sp. TaxID=47478 RepID=UPI0025E9F47C|nr:HlyD family efflux transporter periplasmic adaptor subunit [Deinococcus sp.]